MRSVLARLAEKGESQEQAILTRVQDIAARGCRDFFVYTVGDLIWMARRTVVQDIDAQTRSFTVVT